MFQKPYIILVEKPHIVNLIFQKGDSFKTYSEREADIFIGIDVSHFKYSRVYHAAAKDFYPAAALAESAALAAALKAAYVHLGRRLCEREVMRTEFNLGILTEKILRELGKCSLKIREGNLLINYKSFNLVEAG